MVRDGIAIADLLMVRALDDARPEPGPDGTRRLGPGDWRMFRDIRLEMLRQAPQGFGTTHAEWLKMAPDQIMDWLRGLHLWAVVDGGRVLATAGWRRLAGQVQAHRGQIIAVYATPRARGLGHVKCLLRQIEDEARAAGIRQLELDVGTENADACALYRSAGFGIVGTIPSALGHSGHSGDQHMMIRRLSG